MIPINFNENGRLWDNAWAIRNFAKCTNYSQTSVLLDYGRHEVPADMSLLMMTVLCTLNCFGSRPISALSSHLILRSSFSGLDPGEPWVIATLQEFLFFCPHQYLWSTSRIIITISPLTRPPTPPIIRKFPKRAYLKSEPSLFPLSGMPGSGHILCPCDTPTWVTTRQKHSTYSNRSIQEGRVGRVSGQRCWGDALRPCSFGTCGVTGILLGLCVQKRRRRAPPNQWPHPQCFLSYQWPEVNGPWPQGPVHPTLQIQGGDSRWDEPPNLSPAWKNDSEES